MNLHTTHIILVKNIVRADIGWYCRNTSGSTLATNPSSAVTVTKDFLILAATPLI